MTMCTALPCSALHSTVQYSTVQCSAVQCSAVQCSAVQCSAVQYSTVQYSTVKVRGKLARKMLPVALTTGRGTELTRYRLVSEGQRGPSPGIFSHPNGLHYKL